MADTNKQEFEPKDLRESLSNVAPQAFAPQSPNTGQVAPHVDAGGRPAANPADQAQQTHMQQQDRPDSHPDRDEKLVSIGRGTQTTGRQKGTSAG